MNAASPETAGPSATFECFGNVFDAPDGEAVCDLGDSGGIDGIGTVGGIEARGHGSGGGHQRAAGNTPGLAGVGAERAGAEEHVECLTYDAPGSEHQITLRTPAELADALPYLLGYRPEDSIVLVALHDRSGRGRFGGRARLGIPSNEDDWASVARQLTHGLITGSERRGRKPEQMVAYLCQEPAKGESGRQVMTRLASLAATLRTECGRLDVPVIEALCISDGRFWSYCCPSESCCPPEGMPMGLPGTSVLAAAATYAGLQVRGTLRELRARLQPWETAAALEQETVLDATSMRLLPRMLDGEDRARVAEETVRLAERVMTRLAEAPRASGALQSDMRDDELLGHPEAAALIIGLQDRTTRDRVAEWMEVEEAGPALRLWRALARRCVGSYGEHAAAPLTLAGWVAWSSGDGVEAREALAMALGADSGYLFARLLHQACNEGLDPESIRSCLRAERERRARSEGTPAGEERQSADAQTVPAQYDGTPASTTEHDAAPWPEEVQPLPSPSGASRRRRRTRMATRPVTGPTAAEIGARQPGEHARGKDGSGPPVRTAGSSRPGTRRVPGSGPSSPGKETAPGRGTRTGKVSSGDDTDESKN
ncbi:DUF4192 domain-containing protein [Streptomyces sp. NPDC005574]|uniref:DUF4192 domain-containing protein n=1 Tax=Streptomyces sp. NPDC005574 TaxID=3156891 RepID=UPI0033A8568E